MICYIGGNFEAGNSLNLAVIGGCRSTFDDIDFATLPAQRFWRETVSLIDVM